MGLPVGDHCVYPSRGGELDQAVEGGEHAGQIPRPGAHLALGPLREGTGAPGPIGLGQEGLEIGPTAEAGHVPGGVVPDPGRRLVEGNDQLQRLLPERCVEIGAERVRPAGQERKDRQGVAVRDAIQEPTCRAGYRRHDEGQAGLITQPGRRVQGASQPAEHGVARRPEPCLLTEVVDRHEPGRTRPVVQAPLVTASALRHVHE